MPRVLLEHLDRTTNRKPALENRENKETREIRVPKETKELLEHRVLEVLWEIREMLVPRERMV